MRVYAMFNQKGGVGKTSIACNLAASFASKGLQTILLDLDAQSNATHYVTGHQTTNWKKSVSDFFEGSLGLGLFSAGLRDMIVPTPLRNLHLIPADGRLIELQAKLESRYKIFKLRDALRDLDEQTHIDVVVIDCPPALNFYSMSALMASDQVLVPFDCDAFAANGLKDVINIVNEVREDHNPNIVIGGVIINHYLSTAKQPQEAIKAVEALGLPVLKPYLTSSVVMRESHDAREPLVVYRPKHKLTQELLRLATNIFDGRSPTSSDHHLKGKSKIQKKSVRPRSDAASKQ